MGKQAQGLYTFNLVLHRMFPFRSLRMEMSKYAHRYDVTICIIYLITQFEMILETKQRFKFDLNI